VVVVGLPLTLRGERGAQAAETEAFIVRLRSRCRIPIITEDERLTTSIARRQMPTSSRRRSSTAASDDAQAAAVLLQTYLDRRAAE
jgi:putative holliday junction resolvase